MGIVHKRYTEYPTHRKQVAIIQPELFEEFFLDYGMEADFNKISIRQPYLGCLYENQLYLKRMSQNVNKK